MHSAATPSLAYYNSEVDAYEFPHAIGATRHGTNLTLILCVAESAWDLSIDLIGQPGNQLTHRRAGG